MFKQAFLLLLALFAISHAYITDIAVDGPTTQIYVTTETNTLFEVDSETLTQNYVHSKPGITESGTLFVGKRGNQRALYDFVQAADNSWQFVYYPVPLTHQAALKAAKTTTMVNGLSLPSTYDQKDNRAIHSVSRNLTLVDLNTMQVLDSFTQWVGSRRFGRNVVYNHNNKRVYTFYTAVPVRAPVYGLSVEEHSVATGKFVEVPTTYNCLCEEPNNATASPFYQVVFADGSCSMDYSVTPARIWCAYPEGRQLFSFNSNNLTSVRVVSTSAAFDNVAWDFTNKVAYAIASNTEATGFTVAKVQLSNGVVSKTYTNTEVAIDASVFKLDSNEAHLYIAVDSADKIISVNTNNMASAKVVTLSA